MPQFSENVSASICDKLANISFHNYKHLMHEREKNPDVKGWNQLRTYCKSMMKSGYERVQNYEVGKANGFGHGRKYVQGFGLQNMTREIRSALCQDGYHDIDMVNCAPRLILKIIKDKGLDYETGCLENYIKNRENCLQDLCQTDNIDRSTAKKLFISSLYSSVCPVKAKGKHIKNKPFIKFDKEMKIIQSRFEDCEHELKTQLKLKDRDYHRGKLLCHIVHKLEAELLDMAIDLIEQKEEYWIVPIFDGFLLSSVNDDDETWIDTFLTLLELKTGVEWDVKPPQYMLHNDFILNMDNDTVSIVGYSDRDCGTQFIEKVLNNNFIACNSAIYLLSDNEWISNEKCIKSQLKRILGKHEIIKITEKEDGDMLTQNISSDYTLSNNFIERGVINNHIVDNDFINRVWEDSLKKIYFKNGYYDFKTMKFNEGGNETFIRAPIELHLESNAGIRHEIYRRILYPIFTIKEHRQDCNSRKELMRYMMSGLAKMMAGKIELKKWFLATGMRDSGKGVLADLLKYCFGRYIGFTGSSNFKMKSSDIDAKSHSWIIDYQFKRMAICSEISVKENSYVDGTMLKQFCSGGDAMEARKNFKDEQEFKIQAGLLIFGNDMPPVQPSDAYEKCDKFDMKSKFVSSEDYEMNESNHAIEYYEKDDSVKTVFIKDPAVHNEFVIMLIEAYDDNIPYPAEIKEEIMLEMEEDDDEKMLLDMFITKTDGFISNKELQQISKKIPSYSLLKVKKILKARLGAIDKRINHNVVRGLGGIQFKGLDEEN